MQQPAELLQQKLLITPAMCSMLQLLASKLGQQPSTLLLGAADAVIANMLWFSLDSLERFTQFVESVMRPETFIAVVMVSLKISISSNGDVSAEEVGTPAPRTCNTAPVLGPHEAHSHAIFFRFRFCIAGKAGHFQQSAAFGTNEAVQGGVFLYAPKNERRCDERHLCMLSSI